jgi:hypothetical protein
MPNSNKSEIIYTRVKPEERRMLDHLKNTMVRTRSDVIRYLIVKEYERQTIIEKDTGK